MHKQDSDRTVAVKHKPENHKASGSESLATHPLLQTNAAIASLGESLQIIAESTRYWMQVHQATVKKTIIDLEKKFTDAEESFAQVLLAEEIDISTRNIKREQRIEKAQALLRECVQDIKQANQLI